MRQYSPSTIEPHCYAEWEKKGYFRFSGRGQPYCIMLPPPNVTGSLHMGHGFQVSLMDALIRYHRMLGKNVLWQGGTDHAGIATQIVVEQQLLSQDKTRLSLGRKQFLEEIWKWKASSGDRINQQLRRLGASIDWTRERFTCDPGFNQAVVQVFSRLYHDGLIYRGKRLVNWDPQLQTAISDLEVISTEESGYLWHIRYPLLDGVREVVVATTRPETLLGDVAVAIHPEDHRYRHLLGQRLRLPLTDRLIPLIADSSVDPTFGTGCVKITPAHNFQDYALSKRHHLTPLTIFTRTGHLNDCVPALYQGLDRFTARKRIINDLSVQKQIEKVVPHRLSLPRSERSGAIIEPYLTDQWFMKMTPLAEPAISAIQTGQVRFEPDNWGEICLQWLTHIDDWCLSRQIWWGHQIPAWYTPDNAAVYVGTDEATIRHDHCLPPDLPLRQDEDVLDTWFSSALWPFVSLGWPDATYAFKTFYPTDVLITGFDILFFWVARMLMLSLYCTQQIPFKTVYVTGLIRDHQGQKMSKSKGNVLDPMDIIQGIKLEQLLFKRTHGLLKPKMSEKISQITRQEFPNGISSFGADALRFSYCALASPTRDIHFDLKRTEGYRNFCNKLWNAAYFVLKHHQNRTHQPLTLVSPLLINRWINSRLQKTIRQVHQQFEAYRFDLVVQTLHHFIWHEYCDWYLEATKIIRDFHSEYTDSLSTTLIQVLESSLRLLHPLMPFITEAIWQELNPILGSRGSLMLAPYPTSDSSQEDDLSENAIAWLQKTVTTVRTIRSEMGIKPGIKIPLLCRSDSTLDRQRVTEHKGLIIGLTHLSSLDWIEKEAIIPPAAVELVDSLELLIPVKGLVDIATEIRRLEKEMTKWEEVLKRSEKKLADRHFIRYAPPTIVDQEGQRITISQSHIKIFKQRLHHLREENH